MGRKSGRANEWAAWGGMHRSYPRRVNRERAGA
jgi:hypothetical protein